MLCIRVTFFSDTPVGEHVYYVTFHIKPAMNDFEIFISPHNTYTDEIEITKLESDWANYRFRAHCSGPVVDCEDLWVEEKLTLKPSLRIKNKLIVTNQGATG